MGVEKSAMVTAVRIVLDENSVVPQVNGVSSIDALSIDDMINDSLPRAFRVVLMNADQRLLGNGTDLIKNDDEETKSPLNVITANNGVTFGQVILPDDFLRLLSVKLDSWYYAVGSASPRGDEEYVVQHSPVRSLVATSDRPKAVITPDGTQIELFPAMNNDTLTTFRYISSPDDNATTYDISDKLYASVIYTCASLVCATLGEFEKSKTFESIAEKYYNAEVNVS